MAQQKENGLKIIDADLKAGQIRHAYLLYGVERYLLLQYRDKLVNALTGYDDTMNFTRFSGADVTEEEIIDLAETLPFFAEKRVILMEETGLFRRSCDKLSDYLASVPDTTYLIFCESNPDGRSNLMKAVKKYGYAADFERLDPATLRKWILSRIKREGKSIRDDAYELFITRTGNDMALIDTELEKLFCYTLDREAIFPEDVELLVTSQMSDRVFDMIDAMVNHNKKKTFDLYYELLALKVPAVKTLSLIGRHYRILLNAKSMKNSGKSVSEISAELKTWDRMTEKYLAQVRDLSLEDIKAVLEDIDDLDHAFKTSDLSDQLAVELFLLRHC